MILQSEETRHVPPIDLLSWIFENKEVDPEKDILIDAADDTKRLNTRQAICLIRRFIAGLKDAGLMPGDVACVHTFNHILHPILYLGIIGAGGTFVGSNPRYKTLELNHLFLIAEPKYFVIEASLIKEVLPALEAARIPTSRIFLFNADDDAAIRHHFRSWKALLQYGEMDWIRFDDEAKAKSTTAILQLTSGTTGLPKVAVTSHYALVAAGVAMQCSGENPYQVSRLISLPLFHSFGSSFVHLAAFRSGEPTYIMPRFDLDSFTRCVQRYKITEIVVVPPMVASIVDGKIPSLFLQSLRRVWCAGSPLSRALNDSLYRILHEDAVISQVWGMTEYGRITLSEWGQRDMSGSVGKLLPNTEARVIDEQGRGILEEGISGELWIRGPPVMTGYLNHESTTTDTSHNDWLATGDLGYIKDGRIHIVGRIKELIKVRGWQVSPSELENTLLLHPSIADAAVIGVKIRGRDAEGELPRAYVVVRPENSSGLDGREVMAFIKDRLASFKALDGGVVFVDHIPRSGSGKILRRVLRERVMAELQMPSTAADSELCSHCEESCALSRAVFLSSERHKVAPPEPVSSGTTKGGRRVSAIDVAS